MHILPLLFVTIGSSLYGCHREWNGRVIVTARNQVWASPMHSRVRATSTHRASRGQAQFEVPTAEACSGAHPTQILLAAAVPPQIIGTALETFPPLTNFSSEGTRHRLLHLNYLIRKGVYTYDTACQLLAEQPRFLQMEYRRVHEDDELLVFSKPFDVRMNIPSRPGGAPKWPGEFTCEDYVRSVCPGMDKMRFVHNLDSATSGVLVVGKTREAAARCVELFETRAVTKEYIAIVRGHVAGWEQRTVDGGIEKDPYHGFRMRVSSTGKHAITHVRVLERGHVSLGAGHVAVTKLLLMPVTGRRHQLRVHMLSLGHPILGDAGYAEDWLPYRLFLHAFRLHLPFSPQKDLRLEAPDPFIGHMVRSNQACGVS